MMFENTTSCVRSMSAELAYRYLILNPCLENMQKFLVQRCLWFHKRQEATRPSLKQAGKNQLPPPKEFKLMCFLHQAEIGSLQAPGSTSELQPHKYVEGRFPPTLLWSFGPFFQVLWGWKASFFQVPAKRLGLIESRCNQSPYLLLPTQFPRQTSWYSKCGLKWLNVASGWWENYCFSLWMIEMWEEATGGIQNKTNSNNNADSGEKGKITLLTLENPVKS